MERAPALKGRVAKAVASPSLASSLIYAEDFVQSGPPGLDFHELRHWCGHHFYITLGFSAEEAGAQLGHKDGRQIVQTYGHGRPGALQRLHRGTERPAEIRSIQTLRAREGGTR
jgi:integrase